MPAAAGLLSPIRRPDSSEKICASRSPRLALTTAVEPDRKSSIAQAFLRATIAGRTASPFSRDPSGALVRVFTPWSMRKGTTPFHRHEKLDQAAAKNRFLPAVYLIPAEASAAAEAEESGKLEAMLDSTSGQSGPRAQACTSSRASRFARRQEAMGVRPHHKAHRLERKATGPASGRKLA